MCKVKCEDCLYGIPVDPNERVLLCDNPNLKTYGKNVKHGRTFSCGSGVPYNAHIEVASVDIQRNGLRVDLAIYPNGGLSC